MTEEQIKIIESFNSERFEKMTEMIYAAQMGRGNGSVDTAQFVLNNAMNAAYLYSRNFEACKRHHIKDRISQQEQNERLREEGLDQFGDPLERNED
jgi:hypothetical protein